MPHWYLSAASGCLRHCDQSGTESITVDSSAAIDIKGSVVDDKADGKFTSGCARPWQATAGPEVAAALETVAADFVGKTLEVGCAVARRRGSDVLAPADMQVGLARMW